MHLHYRFTNNSTWKHVKMWVKIPEGYYFKNVTYSILDSLNPANPIYQKVINCADKRYVEKNIKDGERGKEYFLTWDIAKEDWI